MTMPFGTRDTTLKLHITLEVSPYIRLNSEANGRGQSHSITAWCSLLRENGKCIMQKGGQAFEGEDIKVKPKGCKIHMY